MKINLNYFHGEIEESFNFIQSVKRSYESRGQNIPDHAIQTIRKTESYMESLKARILELES